MTLEEAIAHCLEKGQEASPCGEEHRLLAEWLQESADLRRKPRTIRDWQKVIHEQALSKGWWDPEKLRSFGDICALFHTEISEAYEEYRTGHGLTEIYDNIEHPGKPEGIPVEITDLVIRVFDWCEWAGVDLQAVMEQKHAYNKTRSHRHDGKTT